MDNQVQNAAQSQENSTLPINNIPVQAIEERVFKQSELNDIVGRAKAEAVDTYRRKQETQPAYVQQKYGESAQAQAQGQSQFTPEENYRKIAAEEAQRLRDEWVSEAQTKAEADAANRIVQNFWNKINPGKEKYQDFEQVTGDIEYSRFPNTVQLLAEYVDNSHDVLYELGKNRMKMAQIEQLSYMSPKDAVTEIKRLADSIKANEAANKIKSPNEPLSHIRASSAGTDNGDVLSWSDLKRKYRS